MKIIFKIAKKELRLLFYSPIAWVLLLSFIIQVAVIFCDRYMSMVYATAEGMNYPGVSDHLFTSLNNGHGGLWEYVQGYLFLYIPLLTMGIVSRDISNSSIKLMYSSPVNNVQIILGKYFALIGYAFVMMLPLIIFVAFGWATTEDFQISWVMTGLLGLFLLVCTYMAIGIFVSSLTVHQAISAICSFMLFMFFGMVGKIGQQYDFVRDITYWLSLNGRTESFIKGMICSEDLLYFITICMTFIAMTIIRLNSNRQKIPYRITFLKYIAVLAGVFVVVFVTIQPALTWTIDATASKKHTLVESGRNIIKNLKGKYIMTAYVNIFDRDIINFKFPDFFKENINDFRLFTRCNPNIKIKTIYYYAQECAQKDERLFDKFKGLSEREVAEKVCLKEGINFSSIKTKEEVDQMADLSSEGYVNIREIVSSDGHRAFYRNKHRVGVTAEASITGVFKRFLVDVPKIGYIKGHNERGLTDNSPMGYLTALGDRSDMHTLWNKGFDIEEITLHENLIGDNYSFIILADPREELSSQDEAIIGKYIEEGGNILILAEPNRRELLNPLLYKYFGVELTPLVVTPMESGIIRPNQLRSFIQPPYNKAGMKRLVSRDVNCSVLMMTNASAIKVVEDRGFNIVPFAKTDSLNRSWTELETTDFENDSVTYNPKIGEVEDIYTTMVGLTRECGTKNQKVIIVGDADVISNMTFTDYRDIYISNKDFMDDVGSLMSDFKMPYESSKRVYESDIRVSVGVEQFQSIKWLFMGLMPFLVLGYAVFLWIRRRGR